MLGTLTFFLFFTLSSKATFVVDPARPHLDSLESKGRMDWEDYQDDFIISQSAEITDFPASELIERLRKHHASTQMKLLPNPRFSVSSLPQKLTQGDQLKALKTCSKEKCDVKLHYESEVLPLLKSSDRISFYASLIEKRIHNYSSKRELKGYEKRLDNNLYARKALELSRFLKSKYPKTFHLLLDDFWKKRSSSVGPQNDYFRSELIQLVGERSQPVFRITHNTEFQESGYLNIEFHLYTNHFMDSSLRIFEIFPWQKDNRKSVFIVTDLVEVDELKKSAFIQKLITSRIEEALADFRKSEMKALR